MLTGARTFEYPNIPKSNGPWINRPPWNPTLKIVVQKNYIYIYINREREIKKNKLSVPIGISKISWMEFNTFILADLSISWFDWLTQFNPEKKEKREKKKEIVVRFSSVFIRRSMRIEWKRVSQIESAEYQLNQWIHLDVIFVISMNIQRENERWIR